LNILDRFWKNTQYQISRKSVLRESSYSMRTDRQTQMTMLIVTFLNFAKWPNTTFTQETFKA